MDSKSKADGDDQEDQEARQQIVSESPSAQKYGDQLRQDEDNHVRDEHLKASARSALGSVPLGVGGAGALSYSINNKGRGQRSL
jgi:hypothetical protein